MAAAAIVPIVTYLIPLIPSLIKTVEGVFGPKTGPKKKEAVVGMVAELIKRAREEGLIAEQDATVQQIAAIIEGLVRTMKTDGSLVEEGKEQKLLGPGRRFQLTGVVVEMEGA